MENNLTKQHLNHLTESGFTVEQAEAIVRTIEQRAVNKKDLELLKKDLKLWTLGVMISGFILFAGFISYLDSKTSSRLDNIESRFNERFNKIENAIDRRFNKIEERFNKIEERFNRIEEDIKTLLLLNSPNSRSNKTGQDKSEVEKK